MDLESSHGSFGSWLEVRQRSVYIFGSSKRVETEQGRRGGHGGQGRKDRAGRTGQKGQDRNDRAERTGQKGQGRRRTSKDGNTII
jgi:hypothetical protein